MRLVVVVKRDGQGVQCRSRVRLGHPRDVVSLHRFDEAFGHPVALRTSDRRRDRFQAYSFRERQRLLGNVAGTVIAEPFDFVVGLQRTIETVFYSLKHDCALKIQLQFSKIRTAEPLEHAIVGVASRSAGDLIGRHTKLHERESAKITQLQAFIDEVYTARPSSRVMVQRVMLAPFAKAAAFLSITNTDSLPAGSRHTFMVRQSGTRLAAGGGTYVVRVGGKARSLKLFIAPSHD